MKQGSNSRRMRGRTNGKRPAKNSHYDSNGPEVRVRGSAQQVLEKYLTLARDAHSAGDRVSSENYFQHAEHYYRLLQTDGKADGQKGRRQRQQPDSPRSDQEHFEPRSTDLVKEKPAAALVVPDANDEQAIIAELDGAESAPEKDKEEAQAPKEAIDPL
jgi:hypothetical protein